MDDRRFVVVPIIASVPVAFDAAQQASGVVAHVLVEATLEERHSTQEFDGFGPCLPSQNVLHAPRMITRLRRDGNRVSVEAIGSHACGLTTRNLASIHISRCSEGPSAFLIRRRLCRELTPDTPSNGGDRRAPKAAGYRSPGGRVRPSPRRSCGCPSRCPATNGERPGISERSQPESCSSGFRRTLRSAQMLMSSRMLSLWKGNPASSSAALGNPRPARMSL